VRAAEHLEGVDPRALSIAQLYDEVEGALVKVFPRGRHLWVRGEIQSFSDQHGKTGHCYIDLVDPDNARNRQAPVLRVKCWRRTWGPMRASLAAQGIRLEPGMVVVLRGALDFYRARAEISLILAEIDVTALLGRLAAQKAALLQRLEAEGLLRANRLRAVPAVPLRVGLVASPRTEGCQDFLGQLTGSGFAFEVAHVPASVQGAGADRSIARAIRVLEERCDVIALVRGGGSKADLSAFDSEVVARAIATAVVPVWTGVGHTGDQSVADVVANRTFITPTECGSELVARVSSFWETGAAAAVRIGRRAVELLAAAEQADTTARRRLTAASRHLLDRQEERTADRVHRLATRVPGALVDAHESLVGRSARLAPLCFAHVERGVDRVGAWRRLLAAYDVTRQLERGYTLTLDADGRAVRTAASLAAGAVVTTRFADGAATSVVREVELAGDVELAGRRAP
jgi:exodeoxyribonuclease VII large subunit